MTIGLATGISSGSATITIKRPGGHSFTVPVSVLSGGSVVQSITISPTSTAASSSQTVQFTGTAYDGLNGTGTVMSGIPFIWSMKSGGSIIGTVNSSGLFTANATTTGSDYVVLNSGSFYVSASIVTTAVIEVLSATPSNLYGIAGTTSSALVIKNQMGTDVTSGCTFATSNATYATVNSSGFVIYVAAGSVTITATHTSTGKTCTISVSIAAAGLTYAWNTNGPISSSIYSAWPTQENANIAAYNANTSKYINHGGSFGSKLSFDASTLIGGQSSVKLMIPSSSTQMPNDSFGPVSGAVARDDMTYHIAHAFGTPKYGYTDIFPLFLTHNASSNTGNFIYSVMDVGFDKNLYGGPTFSYGAMGGIGGFIGGIHIVHQNIGALTSWGYAVHASLTDGSSAYLSTEAYVPLMGVGEEMWDNAHYDWFIRTYRSGTYKQTLNFEIYAGKHNTSPTMLGTGSISMLVTSSMFPQPNRIGVAVATTMATLSQDYYANYGYVAAYDNILTPNLALNYGAASMISSSTQGLGVHGVTLSRGIVPSYSTLPAAVADAGHNYMVGLASWLPADSTHNSMNYYQMSQSYASYRSSGGLRFDLYRFAKEFWTKEYLMFGAGWSNYGVGGSETSLSQSITPSSSPQDVYVISASACRTGGSFIGFGTITSESVNINSINTSSNTINATFRVSHSFGDDVSSAQGPGYKLFQIGYNYTNGSTTVDGRLEMVGTTFETYYDTNIAQFDNAFPSFKKTAHGAFFNTADGPDAIFDVNDPVAMNIKLDVVSTHIPNAQGASGREGTRPGQMYPIEMYNHASCWYDADYGRYRIRLEQYWLSGSVPYGYGYGECIFNSDKNSIMFSPYIFNHIHFGENFNERLGQSQTLDRWGQEWTDPNDPTFGSDPYGAQALFISASYPSAPTISAPTVVASNSLQYNITAPASGSPIKHMIPERYNGTVWQPDGIVSWTAGMGGTQSYQFAALSGSTDYSNKLRIRLSTEFGQGTPTLISVGATSTSNPPHSPTVNYMSNAGYSITYGVTQSVSGGTADHVYAEVYNGSSWIAQGSIAYTTPQIVVVTGLNGSTNYSGSIRFSVSNTDGTSTPTVVGSGSTSSAPTTPFPLTAVYRLKPGYGQDVYVSGSGVGTITDVAGGIIMQQTGSDSSKPIYIPSAMNGKAALQFNSTQSLISVNSIAALHGNDLWELLVVRIDGFPNQYGALISRYQPNTTPIQGMYYSTLQQYEGTNHYDIQITQGSASVQSGGTASPSLSGSAAFGYLLFSYGGYAGGYSGYYWNGTSVNSKDPIGSDFGAGTQMAINRRIETGSVGSTFTLLEHVIGHGVDPNQTTIHTYLQSEYGFA